MEQQEYYSRWMARTFQPSQSNDPETCRRKVEFTENSRSAPSNSDTHLQVNRTNYNNVSTTVLVNGKRVKIHGLCTGTVAVKTTFRTKKGYGGLAKFNMLVDRQFTGYLPIWVWVIEHPDGLIVIDTGEVTAIKNIDRYLANENIYNRVLFRKLTKFNITQQEELDYQFDRINLKLDDVRLVALTHLHLDHTDGLRFFPKSEIIVGDFEYRHPSTNMPSTYPEWFNPNRVKYQNNQIDVFERAHLISKDLYYVPTPGHTPGHSSIIFKTDEFDILFAGDASYNQEQVLRGELAGVNADYRKSRETYKSLLAYTAAHKTIYLPSHDGDASLRLKERIFFSTTNRLK